jgi:EAL domain-containing protein (putative c-di-GMP-specific phosphodiesterase class I)
MEAVGYPIELAVNVSAHQLHGSELLAQVRAACAAVAPASLVLEMTERVVIGDDEDTARTLRALADAGARLALDDFGVGFSSIGYLQHLPVHILKIDRSFTDGVDRDRRTAALIEAMVVMGQALDLEMVAEGVETENQLDVLRDLGCRVGQGFYFARPMPLEDVAGLLRPGAIAARLGRHLVPAAD